MKTKFIITLILVAAISTSIYSQEKKVDITYIANCSFLIGNSNKQVLIDALFKEGYDSYLTPTDTVISKILNGDKPFTHPNLLLITHDHADPTDAQLVMKYLESNRENCLIAPSTVINSIKSQPDYTFVDKQLIEIPEQNQTGIDTLFHGIKIKSFYMQHDNRPAIQNVGYLIDIDEVKIFHSGDNTGAKITEYEKMQLQNENIDIAFLNFYGFWNNKWQRDFTKRYIDPKNIVLMHIPPKEIEAVNDSCKKIADYIDITIFHNSLDIKSFRCN